MGHLNPNINNTGVDPSNQGVINFKSLKLFNTNSNLWFKTKLFLAKTPLALSTLNWLEIDIYQSVSQDTCKERFLNSPDRVKPMSSYTVKATTHKRIFLSADKNLHLSASVLWIQSSLQQDQGLSSNIWQCYISKRLVGPCWLVCAGPRRLGGALVRLNQLGNVMRVTSWSVE